MLTRRLVLASNCHLSKQISNILYRRGKSILLCSVNGLNAYFYTGKVAESPIECHFLCQNNIKLKTMPITALNKRSNMLNRFYSGDPNITFLSGGKSQHFEDNTVYDEDKLLNKVIDQLKGDNGSDISVIETSEERRKYADYVVVVSGRSTRHLKAMTNHIHQQSKKDFPEKHVIVTGLDSDDWMIVDFGSIVIHLFLPEIREKYELEKLWSLGPEHDEQYQEMLEDDRYAEMVKNAKLQDFFVHEESSK